MPAAIVGLILLIIGLVIGNVTLDNVRQPKTKIKSEFVESWVTPSPTPSPKPAVKSGKTIIPPVPTIDLDPIITCNIHANCGGGSKQMRRSECNQTICCQIGGKWYFYLSKEKCKSDQSSYWSNYYKGNYYVPNYDFPTYTYTPVPLPTYQPYQPLPTPTLTEEELQIIIDQIEEDIEQCKREVNSRYNDLVRSCMRFAGTSGVEVCERAYNKEREKELQKCEGY